MTRTSLARALLALLVVPTAMTSEAQDPYARERRLMLEVIAAITRETRTETGRGALAPAVMKAMERVPRERFVPPDLARSAYENRPLPNWHELLEAGRRRLWLGPGLETP